MIILESLRYYRVFSSILARKPERWDEMDAPRHTAKVTSDTKNALLALYKAQ